MLVLAAVLSIQDPRERPLNAQQAADQYQQRFADNKSDFVALLKLWEYLRDKRRELSNNQFRRMCGKEFLAWHRVREWFDLHRQLSELAREEKIYWQQAPADYEQVHKALLSGLLSHAGLKDEKGVYQGARNKQFYIFYDKIVYKHK